MPTLKARVSVCIPVFNGEKYIEETLNSVAAQTYDNIEVLIQNNASTDGTGRVLERLKDRIDNLHVSNNDYTVEMAENWNLVAARATGEYLVLLSADDRLEKDFVARCMMEIADGTCDAVTTNHYYLIDGNLEPRRQIAGEKVHRLFPGLVLLRNPFSVNFTLIHRRKIEPIRSNGSIFKTPYYTCDYDLWIRIANSGIKIKYVNEYLGTYRIHRQNISHKKKYRMFNDTILVLLMNKRPLAKNCFSSYNCTIMRFVGRIVKDILRTSKPSYLHLLFLRYLIHCI